MSNNPWKPVEDVVKEDGFSHYFKDVRHLDLIDVYRVLDLFEVKDQVVGHAVKKLLCAGSRGAKDVEKDINEALESLIRRKQMKLEDANKTG